MKHETFNKIIENNIIFIEDKEYLAEALNLFSTYSKENPR